MRPGNRVGPFGPSMERVEQRDRLRYENRALGGGAVSDCETNGGAAGAKEVESNGNRWLALAVVLSGAFLILLASTIVNVAVPTIQADLGASYAAVQWIISGYALAYGLLHIPAGRLGDRLGYKLMFLFGLAGFMLASVLSAISTSPAALVGWQVAAGAMAGVMNPQILAVIQVAFPPQERGRAFGMYGAVAGVAVAAGPLLGGLLIQWDIVGLSWRPIFLLNVLVGALAFAAALRLLPESRGRGGSLDVVGVALVSAAFLLLTFPLVEGRSAGWPPWAFVCLGASVPTLAGFVLWELQQIRKGGDPLVDVRLFKNRAFAAGTGISLSYFAGFIGLVFVLSLYLQIGLGRSALVTGLILLPFAAGSFVGAAFSDRVADRRRGPPGQVGAPPGLRGGNRRHRGRGRDGPPGGHRRHGIRTAALAADCRPGLRACHLAQRGHRPLGRALAAGRLGQRSLERSPAPGKRPRRGGGWTGPLWGAGPGRARRRRRGHAATAPGFDHGGTKRTCRGRRGLRVHPLFREEK